MIDTMSEWFRQYPLLKQITVLTGILLLSVTAYIITKRFILKWLGMLVDKSKTQLDDIIFDRVMSRRLAYIVPILIIYNFAYLTPRLSPYIQRVAFALIFLVMVTALIAFLHAVNTIYEQKPQYKNRPIKGYIQAVSIIIYIVGGLVMVGILTGQSLWTLLSGVGALTAVIMLIFRDTILSFVAGLQITSNDLVRVGDWIEAPKFNADGDVIELALHIVKVRNFDKTITVIPIHKLIEGSFKNWRGMQESGGRRIKRSLNLDISRVRFLDEALMERLSKIELLKDYLTKKKAEIDADNKAKNIDMSAGMVNGRRMTNLGTFRAYIEAYLAANERIHTGMTFLVRQLPPGPTGLPIQIYVFANDTDWTRYEAIQADIFDHLLAIVKEFDLAVFQYPDGKDFQNIRAHSTASI